MTPGGELFADYFWGIPRAKEKKPSTIRHRLFEEQVDRSLLITTSLLFVHGRCESILGFDNI